MEVEFADTGCGIPESVINKIFDPLFTTKAKGIGYAYTRPKALCKYDDYCQCGQLGYKQSAV